MSKTTKSESDDKMATLKAFRCRNGLCFKCGEKWSPGHTCPAQVSLHVLEELLEAMDLTTVVEEEDTDVDIADDEQEVLALQSDNDKQG